MTSPAFYCGLINNNKVPPMKINHNLRSYIALLTLIPGVLCALLIGAYLTYALIRDITLYESSMGDAYSRQIANQTFAALHHGDKTTLEKTAQLALEYPLLRSITIYGADYQVVAHAGPIPEPLNLNSGNPFNQDRQEFFTPWGRQLLIPVTQPRLAGSTDISVTASKQITEPPAGWVRIEFSQRQNILRKDRTFLIDLIITACVLAAAFWIVMPFSDRMTNTLKSLTARTRALGNSETAPLPHSHIIEIQDLGAAIDEMHATLTQQQESLQHHVEQSTQDLRETLETIEIQNIELDLARREAIQASKIKSEFLANTSHEIRTPLNSIIGFSKLLLKTPLDTQQQDYLHNIRKSSEGLLTLINDVLDLSKIEAGKLVLDYTAFDVNDVVEDVLQTLAPSAYDKGLELSRIIYSDVPRQLLGDPLRLKQVLTNLIGNAIKFSEEGNIVVRVATESTDQQQTTLKVEVTDTGKGLPNNNNQIFNTFTQLDSTSTREHAGTGLGLAISQKIVRQMGGDIDYHSEPGNTVFWFTARFDIASATPINPRKGLLQQQHILVYDREKICRLTISHLLTAWGAQPIWAESIEQILPAVERYAGTENPVNVLLLGLPPRCAEHDIQQLMQVATLCEQRHACKIILCAPSSVRSQLSQYHHNYMLLQKPIAESRLADVLCQALLPDRAAPLLENDHTPTKVLDASLFVLAVDDNASNLKLITTMLQDLGATVISASNGEEAIACYKANDRISVIFMDIQMPIMDGVEATKKIRYLETQNGRRTAIVALTAHALAEQRQHMMTVGMNDFLSKPVSEEQLLHTIEKWCAREQHPIKAPATVPAFTPASTEAALGSGEPCVDRRAALQACGNRADAAREMLKILFSTLEQDSVAIQHSIDSGDMALAQQQIHKLHGACCYCGVTDLKTCCNAMETLIKKDMTEYLADVTPHFHAAVAALLAWKKQHDIATFFH